MNKIIFNLLVVCVFFFLMSTPTVWAQTCEADINNDGEVNKLDWQYFKEAYKSERGMTDCDKSYPAPVPRTGQGLSFHEGDDGDLRKGVVHNSEWRLTYHGDGTITDNLTGLMWTQNADHCGDGNGTDWETGFQCIEQMNTLSMYGYNDWRYPNIRELQSLISYHSPFIIFWFDNVKEGYYWSSTAYFPLMIIQSWSILMTEGIQVPMDKTVDNNYLWPVRGPE